MAAGKKTKTGTKKKTTKKKAKRRGRPPGSKKAKRRGRPPGSKKAKRRGRPPGSKKAAAADAIRLPAGTEKELAFWSDMVIFLNQNKGKTFVVQMDGTNYSLVAG